MSPILGSRGFGRWIVSSLDGGAGPWWYAIFTDTTPPPQFQNCDLSTDDAGNAYYLYSSASAAYVGEPKLYKLTNSGGVTWARRFFGSSWSQNSTYVNYQQGRVLISGVNGTGSVQYNWAQTLNADGTNTAISRSIGIPTAYNATSQHNGSTIDASLNIYASGSYYTGSDYNDFVTQISSSGTYPWTRFWSGNGPRISPRWGTSHLYFHRFQNLYKFNAAGVLINSRGISPSAGAIQSFGFKIGIDASENQYRAATYSSNFGSLYKFDSDLLMVWGKSFSISGIGTYGSTAAIDSAGNMYAIYQFPGAAKSIYVVKANNAGTILWTRSLAFRISGSYPYSYKAMGAVYSNGDLILTMQTDSGTNRPQLVVKLPADGTKTGTYTSGIFSWDWVAETPTFTTLTATYFTPTAPNTYLDAVGGAGVPSNAAYTSYAVTKVDIPA
jgi:hypothetical protein